MATEIDLTKFDDVFLGILQHLGKIEPFLEAIFFFLARRTDFFKLMHNREDKMGFPPGVAEQIVQRIFKKYQTLVLGKEGKTPNQAKKTGKSPKRADGAKVPAKQEAKITEIPEPIQTIEIESSKMEEEKTTEEEEVSKSSLAQASKINQDKEESDVQEKKLKPAEQNSEASKETEMEGTVKPMPSKDPDSFNGAVTDKYSWAQTHGDVDVKVPIPKFIKKSKDLEVQIKPEKLWIALKNDPPSDSQMQTRVIIDGKLTHRIRHEECFWSLVPGECLQIHLEKTNELYWTALLEGEPEIDKSKIDTTRDISEFDQQTQADFQKVVYDHHQKLQGKPTSDEQKTHDLLKEAWDAEGSPFKGTPFDPTRVNIAGSGGAI